jgi:hypothetical protein
MMPSISEAWPSHHVHGHESVALLMGESSEPVPEPREPGWSDAFQAHELPPGPIVRASFSRQGGYQAALQLLTGWTRPSAIFTAVFGRSRPRFIRYLPALCDRARHSGVMRMQPARMIVLPCTRAIHRSRIGFGSSVWRAWRQVVICTSTKLVPSSRHMGSRCWEA